MDNVKDKNWKNYIVQNISLDPLDRISEIIFGLIMVLAFTGTASITLGNNDNISTLLWAAVGCNIAWGLVDAIMYLLNTDLERGHDKNMFKLITGADNSEKAIELAKENLDPFVMNNLSDEALDDFVRNLKQLPKPESKLVLTFKDYLIAFEIFLLVFLGTLPVAIPFIFMDDVNIAIRISNAIALLLLFLLGYKMAGYSGYNPLHTALIFVSLGIVMVSIVMLLGG